MNKTLLELSNVSIGYQKQAVLSDVSMSLQEGEIGCILGPSGSGKTSLLRAIAGFLALDDGSIKINGQIASSKTVAKSPDQRAVGLVFQDFALFPHLSVQQNVEFGLHKLSKSERQQRAQEYMSITGIEALANKYPGQISGGQQQRVAIARAIAPRPDLLLMDEAFSSLDPKLREQVAFDVRDIIKRLGLTAILVTHDQTEAFAFADKIAVVAEGKLQQFSSAYELYHEPETFFVANFIGEGAFVSATVSQIDVSAHHQQTEEHLKVAKTVLGDMPIQIAEQQTFELGQNMRVLLRPDDVIHDDASPIKAKVVARNFRGAFIRYRLQLPNSQETVLCFAPSHHDHKVGESFGIRAEVEHVICFQ